MHASRHASNASICIALICAVSIIASCVADNASAEGNLLLNAGFEDGGRHWRTLGQQRYTVVAGSGREGSAALRYEKPEEPAVAGENSHFDQIVAVEPRTLYVAGGWFKSKALHPVIRVATMDWGTIALGIAESPGDWEKVQFMFDSGDNEQVRFQIFAGSETKRRESAPGVSLCDDVVLRRVTEDERAGLRRVDLEVSTERRTGEVSPLFFGTNLLFVSDDDAALADGVVARRLGEMPCRLLRYPGGEMSDNYNWKTQRLEFPDRFPKRAGPPTTSTDEFITFCRTVGAEPIFVANLESFARRGDIEAGAELAAEWVSYCNGQGFHVTYWEIGNETYLGGGLHPMSAEDYARALVKYSTAMKTVDPGIQIGAVGPMHPDDVGGVDRKAEVDARWWPTVGGIAGEHFDFMVVHRYGPPQDSIIRRLTDLQEWFRETFSERDDPPLALTEWNSWWRDGEYGMLHAMHVAQMCIQYIEAGVDMGCFWPMQHPSDRWKRKGLITYADHSPRGAYYVLQMLAGAAQSRIVACDHDNQYVSALATVSKAGDELGLVALNRMRRGPALDVRVTVPGFDAAEATGLLLAAEDAEAAPRPPRKLDVRNTKTGCEFDLPAFSVAAVRLSAGR